MNKSEKSRSTKPANPVETASYFSIFTFWWLKDLFRLGSKGPLDLNGLYEIKSNLRSEQITSAYAESWRQEILKRKSPSLVRVLFKHHGAAMLIWGLLYSVVESVMRLIQPLCLGGLVSYFVPNQTEITRQDAYLYATGIIFSSAVTILAFSPFIVYVIEVSATIRIGCMGLIYQKAMSLPKSAVYAGLNGHVINLLSSDVNHFDVAISYFHDIWKGPLEALMFTYFIYNEIGVSAIIGIAFLLSFIPMQAYLGRKAAQLRLKTAKRTDIRVKIMNEIILGIQVIKMYAWEKSFALIVDRIRRKEINGVRGTLYVRATLFSFGMVSRLSVFLSLISYIYFGNYITARKVFIVSSYFNILNESMVFFWPVAITSVAEGYISAKRIQEYLLRSDLKPSIITKECNAATDENDSSTMKNKIQDFRIKNIVSSTAVVNGKLNGFTGGLNESNKLLRANGRSVNPNALVKQISMESVTAAWTKGNGEMDCSNRGLENVTLQIEDRGLCAIIGTVGSGKSTLLQVVLGELELDSGNLTVDGTVSYAAQEPWLFEGTIRANIVFIDAYDEHRYKQVIKVCALERDFLLLPFADLTVVGERGISLSGGQKARVNLARAIYKQADIYLLDDPLSAVDAHVGKHIFLECIEKFLANKICVLVTHQLQYLTNVEHLVLLSRGGRIEAQGTYDELRSMPTVSMLSRPAQTPPAEELIEGLTKKRIERQLSQLSCASMISDICFDDQHDRTEQQAIGSVQWSVYKSYLQAVHSKVYVIIIVLTFVVVQFGLSGLDIYIAQWVNWEQNVATGHRNKEMMVPKNESLLFEQNHNVENIIETEKRQRYILLYSVLMTVVAYMFVHRTFAFYTMCLRASINLHEKIFNGITRATMFFYNNNPSGRILNRFAKDITNIDVVLPPSLMDCLACLLELLAIVVIVSIVNYWLLIPTIVMGCFLFVLRYFYISTSRSLKRIEAIRISPVFAHTNESLQGSTTIRAFEAKDIVQKEFHQHLDFSTEAWYLKSMSTRAFALWLDIICLLYISTVTLSFMVFNVAGESGNVGLVILQCINMIGMCQWGIRQTAEVENQMTSVERIMEYVDLPAEPALKSDPTNTPPIDWPSKGEIAFNNLSFRYSNSSAFVLKDLNLKIRPKEKIGIVGRTGAGKSSIIQALFRLANLDGVIEVDGIDINSLGLHDLRSKISIIPQDPVLFSGSLRYNLDPFELCTDDELWNALADVKLKSVVSANPYGLNCVMSESGSNFSMGQRQMVCLARAILRRNRILILDEATANVDPDTDRRVQETIREKFKECTVLTIAHRLNTVMDSDRVLVIDAGRAVEFDHPHLLLQLSGGHLRQLVTQTGSQTARQLEQEAAQSYKSVQNKKD